MDLPGMTRYPDTLSALTVKPFTGVTTTSPLVQRNIVLLATAAITKNNIFMNGLYQNVYVLYRMFEAMGWLPLLTVNNRPESAEDVPHYMRDLRAVTLEDLHRTPIPVKLYIEIGMSIGQELRRFLKMCGAKICKLYLGNILNIDTETPVFYPQMHFSHHVIGELDEIWVSPHYFQHADYARSLNHVSIDKKEPVVVPYVWEPQMFTNNGEKQFSWRPPQQPGEDVFLILEPNISFQKCSLVPLMILEAWYRKNPDWKGEVVMVNGERLMAVPFFRETIVPSLNLVRDKKVKVTGRMDILTLLTQFPSAIPICHQWNNEYNYMVLEYFHAGYPVLHNASDWGAYGYYYPGSDFAKAAEQIDAIRSGHAQNREIYKAHARALTWRHSAYNPDVHRAWNEVIQKTLEARAEG